MSLFKKPVDVLKEYGLSPNDITDVIITHSHHDHIEAIRYYENATIHIQKDEYDKAAVVWDLLRLIVKKYDITDWEDLV